MEALTKVANLCLAGKVPDQVAPYLCGARLHAANKKDGGIRPIAIGNLLRRLVSKLAARGLASKSATRFAPNQLGVGVRGGCETIIHAVRQLAEQAVEQDQDEEDGVLQVDLINAFNQADRGTGLRETERHFP